LESTGESLLSMEKEEEKHDQKPPEEAVADWKWETTRLR
jgi:hypothetical protein